MEYEPDDTQTRGEERRRTARILSRVALRIETSSGLAFDATTAVINRHGALILSDTPLEKGSRVEITNVERGGSRAFGVVWCGDQIGGFYKIGVEMLDPPLDFWGDAYQTDG